ncbi:Stk1 family PASTA domain-containing Ser/Thr kinase [Capillibacterium thermochitinicola]|uniref:non-specific serine/threonine protein kinase n=1 Tax=Capillibacterium thermochitinicola TaxID=2699427 RepID=A0A8J6LHY5_9FIRM|nr:Stk1 family PASTA domain-containing Ser/Thr kinase [Capillibacterium thermochitinicola]MBA2132046.1 Stk1 family PASTA domain-containing Ser/Thr kinase [Capillibacterium thermochitinicola]
MIGRLLGNRYRIMELIGEGGMALVYKAECTLLQRVVAIKILREQFSADREFVERFRREAQAAASLSHSNVVNIFDVGQDGDIHYIVMEYIAGRNLKELIREEAPFSLNRALRIALQISEALRHAHEHNIVHRDIKPHNILITEDGLVKVTDFGIARAVTASGFTQTGVVMGSVQYFSPEQAKGLPVGPQSDLYSLGCVLYEMLTGEVPFTGESPIAIALKHLQEEPPLLDRLAAKYPKSVVDLLKRALAKDLDRRYPSALVLSKDIQEILGLKPDEMDFEDYPTQILDFTLEHEVVAEENEAPKGRRSFKQSLQTFGVVLVSLMIALGLAGVGYLYLIPPRAEVAVPNFVGFEFSVAERLAHENGLKLNVVKREPDDTVQPDGVLSQVPKAGMIVRRGRVIDVVLSSGIETVLVPDLTGKTLTEAEILLDQAGLKRGDVYAESNRNVPKDRIVRQKPAPNTKIQKGASVDIYRSLGPEYVEVPNFIGSSLVKVQSELASLGLVFNDAVVYKTSPYPRGNILDQSPLPGEVVPLNTEMRFTVSSGPAGFNSEPAEAEPINEEPINHE